MAEQQGEDGIGVNPEPRQASDTLPQSMAGGYNIAIRRTGRLVEITPTSGSEYASIEMVQSVRKGSLRLELRQ